MKKFILSIAVLLALTSPKITQAQTYVLDKTISLPGDAGWDYLSVDKVNSRLYVSHGNSVNVVDMTTDQPIGVIPNLQGIHGIAIDNKANRGFISDGRANAVVAFDLKTLATIATIPVTATGPDWIPIPIVYLALMATATTHLLSTRTHYNKLAPLTWVAALNLQWLTAWAGYTTTLKIKTAWM
jgi:hypothetical protein